MLLQTFVGETKGLKKDLTSTFVNLKRTRAFREKRSKRRRSRSRSSSKKTTVRVDHTQDEESQKLIKTDEKSKAPSGPP